MKRIKGMKKLLEAVLGVNVVEVSKKDFTSKIWYTRKGDSLKSWTETCTFVIKCKEYAWKNGYSISTSIKFGPNKEWLIQYETADEYIDRVSKEDALAGEPNISDYLSTNTEAEGVFKACIEIMKILKDKK